MDEFEVERERQQACRPDYDSLPRVNRMGDADCLSLGLDLDAPLPLLLLAAAALPLPEAEVALVPTGIIEVLHQNVCEHRRIEMCLGLLVRRSLQPTFAGIAKERDER